MLRPLSIIDRGRGPELAGTRITVFDIIYYLKAGRSPNYIAAVLLMSTREVEFLIQYIEEHKDEVMAMNAKIEERIARGNPPEIQERMKGARERLLARREELLRRKQQEANGASDPEWHREKQE